MPFTVRKIQEEKPRRRLPWKPMLLWTLELSRPVLHWYQDWKKQREEEKKHQKRVHILKRALLILVSILAALLILAGLAKALLSVQILSFSQLASITGIPPPADENGFTNILLLGQGNSDHDGKDLTDTIIVASLDPKKTKSVVLLSFPRDLYFLKTEKMGKGKLNTFYRDYKGYLKYMKDMTKEHASREALEEFGAEMGRKLDLPIHGVIKVDFTAFEEAVDTLGGVDIDVPYNIVDLEYPDENYGYEPFEISAGMQHLDGKTALKYARSRSTTSDFARSARQQQLLAAMAEKAKEKGLHKDPKIIIDFLKIFRENVETTLGFGEIVGLTGLAQDIKPNHIISMQMSDRNALYDSFIEPGGFLYSPPRDLFDGASVLLPVSIPEFPVTWKQPRTFKNLLLGARSIYLEKPVISVLNAGAPTGTARKLATELTRYGFTVDVIANASLDKQENSFVATTIKEASTAEDKKELKESDDLGIFFASILNINTKPMPEELHADEVRKVTIVLGKDHQYKPLQSLVLNE